MVASPRHSLASYMVISLFLVFQSCHVGADVLAQCTFAQSDFPQHFRIGSRVSSILKYNFCAKGRHEPVLNYSPRSEESDPKFTNATATNRDRIIELDMKPKISQTNLIVWILVLKLAVSGSRHLLSASTRALHGL